MFPDLFSIGPFTVHTYGAFMALSFIVAILVTVRLAPLYDITRSQVLDMGFIAVLWGIIGSRIAYVIMNFSYYRTYPLDIFKIWQGGVVFSGSLIAALIALYWYSRKHKISMLIIGDLCSPAAAIGQAVGRVGCLMAGCCYGKPTDLFWGITFTHPGSLAPLNTPLHPTQIYSSLSGFIIFIIALFMSYRKRFKGQVFLWFLILHSTSRLFVERFRGDDRGMILGGEMTLTQLFTLIILIAAVAGLFFLKSREGQEGK